MRPSSAWGCKTSPGSITRRRVRGPNASQPGAESTAVNRAGWRRRWGTSPAGAGRHQKTYERRPVCMNGEAKSPLA
jgi:hypothetical protein